MTTECARARHTEPGLATHRGRGSADGVSEPPRPVPVDKRAWDEVRVSPVCHPLITTARKQQTLLHIKQFKRLKITINQPQKLHIKQIRRLKVTINQPQKLHIKQFRWLKITINQPQKLHIKQFRRLKKTINQQQTLHIKQFKRSKITVNIKNKQCTQELKMSS